MSFPMHMSELDVLTLEYLEPENQREVSASRTLIPWQRYAKNREQTKSSTPVHAISSRKLCSWIGFSSDDGNERHIRF